MIWLKGYKKAVFFLFLVLVLPATMQVPHLFAQAFPDGATQGTMQMNPEVEPLSFPLIDLQLRNPTTNQEVAFSVQVLLLLTVLSLAPSILILLTCFLRLSIVFDFIKRALSLQQVPPTTVLNGIAFFLTLFIMWPTFTAIYNNSFKPLSDGEIAIEQAYTEAEAPLRLFMYSQMASNTSYISMFMSMGNLEKPQTLADVPTYVLIPSYILSELTIAFKIGILLYIPFIIIDMVVASILMSMGMIMLPPSQISMPFKLMLFVLVDGWGLLTQQLFNSIIR
ncbi:MAG TPA: flagellar type III secretion system pore protein FliP [Treponemataceae bacterium]|jgi:flagellar biosynthetic protein FliP|nr:flagellar biosynthetic protein FliP [Treponema sp.]HOF11459.1 flagellar type III secretion system pore protein FliP [Treponemataceae bacterium]HOQ93072.1 flagellar type III secretion system pore protein FliP [Treponemataceae bacterium]HPM06260.1 flagellar type III secretion system pore protein FliP [Treponemataceae bacterium]HPY52794.1 flagellar type III secretion system pore protein FliP [Treponemataceae bacterium]